MANTLPVGRGGTGKNSWASNTIPGIDSNGNFVEYTVSQLNTLLGNAPTSPNQSPIVDAGSNKTVNTSNTTLTATASDPDGTITTVLWSKIAGPQEPVGIGFNNGSFTPLRTFTVTGTGNDLSISSSTYQAGDLVQLSGNFRSITLTGVVGASGNPIVFRNVPGETVTIGNPTWQANGGPSYAIQASNSRYFVFAGTHWNNFIINGSDINIDGGGEPYRSAYRNISMDAKTENFEFCYMTVNDGGTSIVAKTDPISGQSDTWYDGTNDLGFMWFHDIVVDNAYNEAFYIGHTAQYWNITTNAPYYPGPYDAVPNSTTYKQPRLINGVKVWNCLVSNSGKDGIQCAASKNGEIYQNEVTNWANVQHNLAHNGGILIGGRCFTYNVHDNIVHDGWGESFQFYGTGPGHVFSNNLLYNTDASSVAGDMASLAGRVGDNISQNNPAQITMTSNTFSRCGTNGSLVRVNGYYNKSGGVNGTDNLQVILNKNILMAPKNNTITNAANAYDSYYVYTENPQDYSYAVMVTKGTGANLNQQYNTVANANVDVNNYYLPNNQAITQGFRKTATQGPQATVIGSTIVSPNTLSTSITGMVEGVYTFKCQVTDNNGATASSNIQVTVDLP